MRRNPPAKWPLPAIVDPPTRKCIKVYVPDDELHLSAFRGALLALQSAYNWQDDPTHKAREVALVWRDILRDMGTDIGCGLDTIEFQQIDDCEVQYRIDGGAWITLADLYSCAVRAINDAIANGTIAPVGQQAAGGQLPAQQCQTYHITLRGNSRWNCPVPVRAGFSVAIANARGATGDSGAITAVWGCPDGKNYFLGACGAYNATQPTDPLQSAAHMRLIGYCNGVYMDMYNASYTVPAGTPDSAFFLQVNDGNISDNQGELQLDVTVCNNETVVEYSFLNSATHGFTDGGCGAYGEPSLNGYRDTWYAGSPSFWNFRMYKQAVRATYLRTIEIEYTLGAAGIRFYYGENCGLVQSIPQTLGAPATQTITINRNISNGEWIGFDHQGPSGNNAESGRLYIRRLKYTFSGLSPWND